MRGNSGFGRIKEERKNLSFFKIFQSADLSSESMRAFPYDFISRVSNKDLSDKMVIRAQWGSKWDVGVSKNQRFYYMEKLGWNRFARDNALGENEFITFTHKGKMVFNVNIYEMNGKEMLIPRKLKTIVQIKKEPREISYEDAKRDEERGTESKTSKNKFKSKKVVNSVEIGESTSRVEFKVGKKKDEKLKTSKKKINIKKNDVPKFTITIRKSYLKFLAIPKHFMKHIPNASVIFTIHHSNGNYSWKVLCLVRENRTIFSSGWTKMAREYPLLIDDICIFKLIKPNEFLLVISKKNREEI